MCWIWHFPEQSNLPEANMDYPRSGIQGYEMIGDEWIDEEASTPPVLKIVRNKKKLEKANHIVTTEQTRVVSARLRDVISGLVGIKEVQFIRTIVECGSEVYDDYYFVRPMNFVNCTDVNKSELEWEEENEFYVLYKKIYFLPKCLAGLDIARDSYSNKNVISNRLKLEIEKYIDSDNIFFRPEDLPSRADLFPWS